MSDLVRLKPGDTIGILGGGQLGRMLALAAAPLGLKTHIFCPEPESPAFDVTSAFTIAAYDDKAALDTFASAVSVVTYEFENVPGPTAEHLAALCPVRPGARALEVAQDRLSEKNFLTSIGIDVAPFARIDTDDELKEALERFAGTGVLKTRRFGYDGKGQVTLKGGENVREARRTIGEAPAVLESFVPFVREVSVITARDVDGTVRSYDPTENVHKDHILKTSTVPADLSAETAKTACAMAEKIATELEYVGVLGVELFVLEENGTERLLVNEIAPRVHNSGHWTMDACQVSQFEQHIRAVAGWPLGNPVRHSDVVMENLIGHDADAWAEIIREPNASLHLYGKTETREGRKMGHANRLKPFSK